MAFYKVLETSFIGTKLCQEGEVVDINTDLENGGMSPSTNLAACDENGDLLAIEAAKPKAAAKGKGKGQQPADASEGNDLA